MQTFSEILHKITDDLVGRASAPTEANIAELIRSKNIYLSTDELKDLDVAASNNLIGFGQLNSLITSQVTDVLVNAPDSVWVDSGFGLIRYSEVFSSLEEIDFLARRLASLAGVRLDDSQPYVDGKLANGVRLHAVLPPISKDCAQISLRFPAKEIIPLSYWQNDLNSFGSQLLADVVTGEKSFVISGETSSGKTTLLKSILAARPKNKRILVLEESAEIELQMPNIVSLIARPPNAEGNGEVTLQNLVRQTLRMRPDSIIIGEIRGAEILEFLLSISSGHLGSGTTIHAKEGKIAQRISLLCQLANVEKDFALDVYRESIEVNIHCEKKNGHFRISQISETDKC